jgi:hypothetical protein
MMAALVKALSRATGPGHRRRGTEEHRDLLQRGSFAVPCGGGDLWVEPRGRPLLDASRPSLHRPRPARSRGTALNGRGLAGRSKASAVRRLASDRGFEEAPVRIPVVEADPHIREFVVEALREAGYQSFMRPMVKTRWHCVGAGRGLLGTAVRLPGRRRLAGR